MSIYCGNDFTGHFIHGNQNDRNINKPRISSVQKGDIKQAAEWAKIHKRVEDDAIFAQEMVLFC